MAAERSRLAAVGYFFGSAGIAVVFIGITGIQIRLLPPIVGFSLFVLGSLVGGLGATLLGTIGMARRKHMPLESDRTRTLKATALGVALLALILLAAGTGGNAPPINDITTDLKNPPAFAPAQEVSAYLERDMSYPAGFIPVVMTHYPELAPFESPLAPKAAYAQALATAKAMGLNLVWQSAEEGRFDATQTTSIFRFVDDFTVRVSASGTGSRIDVRSKSRDGQGDMGANAKRINDFLSRL